MLSFNDNRDRQNGGASFRSAYVESVDKLKSSSPDEGGGFCVAKDGGRENALIKPF